MSDQVAETAAANSILAEWIGSINLSRPIRNISRDFSDGVVFAEIIAHFLPRYISLGNFGSVNSVSLKRYNWETLNKVVLRHLNICLSNLQIQQLALGEQGIIENVLLELKGRIDEAVSEGRFRPTNRRSRSVSSRGGSSLCLNQIEDASNQYSNHKVPISSRRNEEQPPSRGNQISNKHEQNYSARQPPVLDGFTKDQLIEKLYLRIRHLENSLTEREEKIHQLTRQNDKLMEIIRHRKREFDRENSNCDSPSTPPFNVHRRNFSTEIDGMNGIDFSSI